MACLDGVIFAILMNLVEDNSIDLRGLQLPDMRHPQPLTESQISENIEIIFATIIGLDIQLPRWDIDDYFDPNNTVNIILSIVFQLFYKMLDNQINLTSHPGMHSISYFYLTPLIYNIYKVHILLKSHTHIQKTLTYRINEIVSE